MSSERGAVPGIGEKIDLHNRCDSLPGLVEEAGWSAVRPIVPHLALHQGVDCCEPKGSISELALLKTFIVLIADEHDAKAPGPLRILPGNERASTVA